MNMTMNPYKPKKFDLYGLQGISDKTVELHLSLYEGYVKNTNLLSLELTNVAITNGGTASNPAYAELKRRFGFEYNGMVLHEHYFGTLIPGGRGAPSERLLKGLVETSGSFEAWRSDFALLANLRGVGWAVLFQDPVTGTLSSQWIDLHHLGILVGFKPLLVLDVWEHAYLLDYKPADRLKYIDAFFSNIDWDAVNHRLENTAVAQPTK